MEEAKKRDVILQPSRMGLAEHTRQDHIVNAEVGTTIEDIIRPGYWASVARNMQLYDHVEVREETGAWIATFIVVETGTNYAKVFMTAKYDLTHVDKTAIPEAHRVEWKGPQNKFCVIRNSDNQVVQDKLQSKEAAQVWMLNHEQVIAAG